MKKELCKDCVLQEGSPFNAHESQYIGSRFFGYNSPATIARELLKRFTDAGRLRGSI